MRKDGTFAAICLLVVYFGIFCTIFWIRHPNIIYDWQTLISGMLALLAAGVTTWYLRLQINQSNEHENNRLKRRYSAIRAAMPLTLSSLCDYAERMADQQIVIFNRIENPAHNPFIPLDLPEPPAEIIENLKEAIEYTNSDDVSEILADTLSEIQILQSRMSEGDNLYNCHIDNISTYIIQTAKIYARSSKLFEYARRETNNISKVEWTDVRAALNILGMRAHNFNSIRDYIIRREELEREISIG